MTNESEVIMFPLKKEISGPITMDAEAFKANLAAAYSAGAMMMRERAAKAVESMPAKSIGIPKDGFQREAFEMVEYTLKELAKRIRAMEIPC